MYGCWCHFGCRWCRWCRSVVVVIHNHIKYTFIHILRRQYACTILLIMLSQQLKHSSKTKWKCSCICHHERTNERTFSFSFRRNEHKKSVTLYRGNRGKDKMREREKNCARNVYASQATYVCILFNISCFKAFCFPFCMPCLWWTNRPTLWHDSYSWSCINCKM